MKKTTLLIALLIPIFGFSQTLSTDVVKDNRNKGWELGLFLGGATYEGDVHCFDDEELNYFSEVGLALGLQARKHLSNSLALRLNYRYASLSGNDSHFSEVSGHPQRNFSFTNNIHEIAGIIDWEFLGKNRFDADGNFKKALSPYLFAGLGVALGSADTDYQSTTQPFGLQERIGVDERDASSVHFAIPLGIGLKYYASESFSIGFQAGARIPMSDYLDGVKVSGNPDANDYYGIAGVTLGFKLKGKEKEEVIMEEVIEEPIAVDSDGDGVMDTDDNCPNEFGPKSNNGCPEPDTDGDGIIDRLDNCPNEVGPVVNDGCPDVDTDNDGVVDRLDKCPNEAGIVEEDGCPEVVVVDTDKDGFRDEIDNCPNVFSLTNNGCPEKTITRITDFSNRVIHFDNAEDLMKPASVQQLNDLVQIMSENPDISLRITGYTDSRGSEISNQGLSERRAKQIYNYLVSQGVPASRMRHLGYGEAGAIASNDSPAGRALNRRVVIELITK